MSAGTRLFSRLERLLNMPEVAMKNLLSLVTRLAVSTFHAFAQQRLRAEISDPDFDLSRHSIAATAETKYRSKHSAQPRNSAATPLPWTRLSHSDLPTIGVL